jgi:F0F1-type ATP synthase assembly protein I
MVLVVSSATAAVRLLDRPTPMTTGWKRMSTSNEDAVATRRGAWNGLDQSSVMGVELISATLLWAGAGWFIDSRLGTAPWFLAIGALVGNAAGVYLIWLRSGRLDAAEAARRTRSTGDPLTDDRTDITEPPA